MPTRSVSSLCCRPSELPWKNSRTFQLHLRIERKNCANERSNRSWWHGTANLENDDWSSVITTWSSKAAGHLSFQHRAARIFRQKKTVAYVLRFTRFIS